MAHSTLIIVNGKKQKTHFSALLYCPYLNLLHKIKSHEENFRNDLAPLIFVNGTVVLLKIVFEKFCQMNSKNIKMSNH